MGALGEMRRHPWAAPKVAYGSIASFWLTGEHFRSPPENGHPQSRSVCLKRAKFGRVDVNNQLFLAPASFFRKAGVVRGRNLRVRWRNAPVLCSGRSAAMNDSKEKCGDYPDRFRSAPRRD